MSKIYKVYLKGGGPKIEPDENPREAKIAYQMSDELICPLSLHLMIDPVFISSGKTFDRKYINEEFARQKELYPDKIVKCPVTKEPIDRLTPNIQMRSITAKFLDIYKDVQYKGSTWDEIRRLCQVYQEEQERIKEIKRIEDRRKKEQEKLQSRYDEWLYRRR